MDKYKRWQAVFEFEAREEDFDDEKADTAIGLAATSLQRSVGEDGQVILRSAGELRPLRIPAMAGSGAEEPRATTG